MCRGRCPHRPENKVAILVNDPLNLDMNERKLLDGLYNEMASIGMSEVHYMDTIQIQNALQAYINKAIANIRITQQTFLFDFCL